MNIIVKIHIRLVVAKNTSVVDQSMPSVFKQSVFILLVKCEVIKKIQRVRYGRYFNIFVQTASRMLFLDVFDLRMTGLTQNFLLDIIIGPMNHRTKKVMFLYATSFFAS